MIRLRVLAVLMAVALWGCGAAMDVLTATAETEIAHVEACYDAELTDAEQLDQVEWMLMQASIVARYDPVFRMYRSYRDYAIADDEEGAQRLYAVFLAMAESATITCTVTP